MPDWYIFENGPITKYVLGNEFYYEPLTEDDKWVRYFGIIPKSVPLITSLFNRTSAVMSRLITGLPIPPAIPAVRGSARNLRPPRGLRPPPPPPPSSVPPPPLIHTIDGGERFNSLEINAETLAKGRMALRSSLSDTVESIDFAEALAEGPGLDLSLFAPSADDKISAIKEISLDETVSESVYETTQESFGSDISDDDDDSDSSTEVKPKPKQKVHEEVEEEKMTGLSPAQQEALKKQQAKHEEAMSEAKLAMAKMPQTATEVLIPEKEDEANAPPPYKYYKLDEDPVEVEKLLQDAPDFENKVTLDSPPEYLALETASQFKNL